MTVTSLTDHSLTPQEDYWRSTWALLNSFKHITYPDTREPCVHCAVEPPPILEGSFSFVEDLQQTQFHLQIPPG